jgi:hypothetical protein
VPATQAAVMNAAVMMPQTTRIRPHSIWWTLDLMVISHLTCVDVRRRRLPTILLGERRSDQPDLSRIGGLLGKHHDPRPDALDAEFLDVEAKLFGQPHPAASRYIS